MCLFWELRAEGRGREEWRDRRGRAGWRLYLLGRTGAPTPTRPPIPSFQHTFKDAIPLSDTSSSKSPSVLWQDAHSLLVFQLRAALLTSQLTCFCSAVGRSSGRMMWIRSGGGSFRQVFDSVGKKEGSETGTSRRPRAQHSVGTTIFFQWAGSRGWRLNFTLSRHRTVHPHGGREKKSWDIMRECPPPPVALPSVSPPPSPPSRPPPLPQKQRQTHTHTHSALSSYIPGALFFAGKHSSATGGEVELFEGSMESPLPEGSCLLCGHSAFTAPAFSARHRGITTMQSLKAVYIKHSQSMKSCLRRLMTWWMSEINEML